MSLIACCKPLLSKQEVLAKTLSCIKVNVFLLFAVCINIRANAFAQNVTLSEKDAPLDKIFLEIKKQTGFTFVYTELMLKKAKRVTIQVNNASLESTLSKCFINQPLTYTILNQMVVIKEKEKPNFSSIRAKTFILRTHRWLMPCQPSTYSLYSVYVYTTLYTLYSPKVSNF